MSNIDRNKVGLEAYCAISYLPSGRVSCCGTRKVKSHGRKLRGKRNDILIIFWHGTPANGGRARSIDRLSVIMRCVGGKSGNTVRVTIKPSAMGVKSVQHIHHNVLLIVRTVPSPPSNKLSCPGHVNTNTS